MTENAGMRTTRPSLASFLIFWAVIVLGCLILLAAAIDLIWRIA